MVVALACASVAAAHPSIAPGKGHPSTCDGRAVTDHLTRARHLLREAYESGPDKAKIRAAQEHRQCIRIASVRKQIGEYRDQLKADLEQRELAASVTPYPGPNGTRWAIPWYVVSCESHGDWGAYNASSGATGPYQMLPSTYAGVCETCDWSHPDQHLAASRVWARSGGSEWECA